MPTYSYQCEKCNELSDYIFRISDRPSSVDCVACDGTSKRVFTISNAQTNDPHKKRVRKSTRSHGLVMHMYKCADCSNKFDAFVDFSKGEHFEDNQTCPKCSSTNSRWLPMANIDRWSERFPYYDRGLGVMLQSKQHRDRICKERGLTPVDGDWDVEKEFSKWDKKMDSEVKEYNDYCDRLDNHPGFRQFREMRDKRHL